LFYGVPTSTTFIEEKKGGLKGFLLLTLIPSAVILGSIGITFTGWLLKRKRMV
jgi:hypothetical protein